MTGGTPGAAPRRRFRPFRRRTGPDTRRVRFRFTREGRLFVLFTMGVGLAAVNTGNNLLYLMLSLMLSLLLLSGILSEQALRGIRLERHLPRRAFAGAPALVELALHNDKRWLSSYSLEVDDVADGPPAERRCFFLKVPARSSQTARYPRTPARRGRLRLLGYRVHTRYPFAIVEKIRFVPAEGALLVYPRLAPPDPARLGHLLAGVGAASRRVGAGDELAGLREWRAGDEARAVHWRRSASLGRLVVRERRAEHEAHLELAIDPRRDPADPGWDARFEQAIEEAAGLADEALRRGASVEVRAGERRSPRVPGGAPADPILRFLALLGPAPADAEGVGAGDPPARGAAT